MYPIVRFSMTLANLERQRALIRNSHKRIKARLAELKECARIGDAAETSVLERELFDIEQLAQFFNVAI